MQKDLQKNILPEVPEYYLHSLYENGEIHRTCLKTLNGTPVTIQNPGRRNPDNGPDFLDAEIKIGSVIYRGDVEIHLRWQDWFRHGHHEDRRYRRVVLHVLWAAPLNLPDVLQKRFAHVVLSSALRVPVPEWVAAMRRSEHERLPLPEKDSRHPHFRRPELETLAWQRFLRKSEALRSRVELYGWETALHLGLGRALGYHKNSTPFSELIRRLPPQKILTTVHPLQRSPLLFWILLAWFGGLLDRPLQTLPDALPVRYKKLIYRVKKQFAVLLAPQFQNITQWHFSRLRPHNSPYLRLAGYAQILFQYQNQPLFRALLDVLEQRRDIAVTLRELERLLRLPLSPVLCSFLQELLHIGQCPVHSMGRIRSRQFILNILLPLSYYWAENTGNAGFQLYLEDFYFNFPAVDQNSIVHQYARRIPVSVQNYGFAQQGLLEFYHRQAVAGL